MMEKNNKKIPVFISEDRRFLTGEKALEEIKKHNDLKYFDYKKGGIISVDKERWKKAQVFEKNTWMRDNLSAKEDNNKLHKKHFDEYLHLKDKKFKKAIELGCGPFTNIRHIAKIAEIGEVHLLDPLINDYLGHPHCSYKNKKLKVKSLIFWKKIPTVLHPFAIEEFETKERFDLVLMINVIEHCYDLNKIFSKVLEITKKGSYFVFYDKYLDDDLLKEKTELWWDAGHPLRIHGKVILKFLDNNFIPLLKKLNYFRESERGLNLDYYGLYYIGYKKY